MPPTTAHAMCEPHVLLQAPHVPYNCACSTALHNRQGSSSKGHLPQLLKGPCPLAHAGSHAPTWLLSTTHSPFKIAKFQSTKKANH
mmetsp:Transcript_16488/g.35647  ORF Transcript_16488/g.35647 Transcript_16488/m.35647 type:complete len:86 (-) Transcript_16488:1399-1656(-)